MTNGYIRNRIADIERLQASFADEVTDNDSRGPQRKALADAVCALLEQARQLLLKEVGG